MKIKIFDENGKLTTKFLVGWVIVTSIIIFLMLTNLN